MMEYFDNLPKSKPAVKDPFELGRAAMDKYKWDEAIGHFQEAMKHAAGTELVALHHLVGRCRHKMGQLKEALERYEESARLAEQYGDKQGKTNAFDSIGVIWRNWEELDKARQYHEQALAIAREIGARQEEAYSLRNLGGLHIIKGESAKALRLSEDALKILEEIGDREGQALLIGDIGIELDMSEKGEKDKVLQYFERSAELSRETGAKDIEAAALANIAGTRWGMADLGTALGYYEQARKLYREIGQKGLEAGMLANIGNIMLDKGEHENAVASHLEAYRTDPGRSTIKDTERKTYGLDKCLNAMGQEKFVAACEKAGMPKPEAEKLAQMLASSAGKV
jgi:tetratricopeptide (TPR) repeat protein